MSHLTVTVVDGLGRPVRSGLARWLGRAAPSGARGQVTIALVTDARMRRLNREHRAVNSATDVLSFPAGQPDRRRLGHPARGPRQSIAPLGDIAIATGVAKRQARECRHSLDTELRVLALHGLLHLLGYDHVTDRGEMGRLEERLRRRARLPAGLISREAAPRRRPSRS
jgi:probable rRNA maturation factor